jgi:DNA-binding protein
MAERADDNIIRVSGRRPHHVFVNASKKLFERFADVEIHGVSFAINNAVKAAEMLSTLGYADIKDIETLSMPAQSEDQSASAKIVIKLGKSKSFDKAVEAYNSRTSS